MRKALLVVNSVVGSALLTAATTVGTLLYLMFTTGKESVHREGLFGSLFFETREAPGGVTQASMGVANPTALVIVFLLFFVVLALTQVSYRELKQYRGQLIEEKSDI
jgi:hypothetical protein